MYIYKKMSKDSFIDEDFPPNENSLMGKSKEGVFLDPLESRHKVIKDSEIEWKRISEIIPKPVLYEGIISMKNAKYGRISFPYFFSVLSTLLSEYPSIIQQIILNKEYNKEGQYQVKLFVDGEFKIITIDDYFPVISGTNLFYFTRPSNFDIWVLIIEKAWAKINGGYLNIIDLWPGDLFKALTGFSFEELIHHKSKEEEVFNKLDRIKRLKGLAVSTTVDNKAVEEKGLFGYHTYIFEDILKLEDDKNNKMNIIKLRDIDNELGLNNTFRERKKLWSDKLKSKIDKNNKLDLDENEFLLSFEDFYKLFLRTDLCYMLTDGFTFSYEFEESQLLLPKVFNFAVKEDGMASISIFEKNWRYHRELRNVSHPTSLVIAQYDPSNQKIKKIYSKYENNEDVDIIETLSKGFYLVWAYKTTDPNENIISEEMIVRFCTQAKGSVDFVGDDNNFEVIKNIIFQYIKETNKSKIKNNDFFYDVSNSFDKSGLGYELVINPLTDIYQVWEVDSSEIYGFLTLPPHKNSKYELIVGYNDYQIILGIKRYKFGKHCFNIGVEGFVMKGGDKITKAVPKPNFSQFFSKSDENFHKIEENPTFSSSQITKIVKYPTLDHWEIFLDKHKAEYPLIVEELSQLGPLVDEELDLSVIHTNGDIYIGENEFGERFGRGAYIFTQEGTTYIGYWNQGLQFCRGKVYDKNNKLIYEGEYNKGFKEGKGVYNYYGGEKYEGMFVNGVREGKGTFYWKDGAKWEGSFKNDELNGEGRFYDGENTYEGTFKDGDLVEN